MVINKKNLARLAWEQSLCTLRADLESDVHAYVRMSSIHNGLIQVMPKCIHMYVHHKRIPLCIASHTVAKGRL